jgi:hypothetical protein
LGRCRTPGTAKTSKQEPPPPGLTIRDVNDLIGAVLDDDRVAHLDVLSGELMDIVAVGLRRAGHFNGLTLNEIEIKLGDVRNAVTRRLDQRFREELIGVRCEIESTLEALLDFGLGRERHR